MVTLTIARFTADWKGKKNKGNLTQGGGIYSESYKKPENL
jgi:hypothetical protein